MLEDDFRDFIELLNKHSVAYMVVGGLAVNSYGYSRNTGDMDVWIKNTEANAMKMVEVIKDFGFGSMDLSIDDFVSADQVVQLGFPPVRIDIMQTLSGVDFDEAYKMKSIVNDDEVSINFIGINELIANKEVTGRYKDLADAEALRKILKRKK
jgi:hypothetical protein